MVFVDSLEYDEVVVDDDVEEEEGINHRKLEESASAFCWMLLFFIAD